MSAESSGDAALQAAIAALKRLLADGQLDEVELPYARVLRQARECLGPFSSLPQGLQHHLRQLCIDDDKRRTLSEGSVSHLLLVSGTRLSRVLYRLERGAAWLAARIPPCEPLRQALRRTARQSTHLPFLVRRWTGRALSRLRLRLGYRDLASVLDAKVFDPRRLAYDYVEGMHQLRGCESALRRPGSFTTYSQLLGLDFVVSAGRCWFLEVNCNPVLMDARLALYLPGEDPWVTSILSAATARGCERIVVYGYRPFAPGHGRALVAGGKRSGIRVDIFNDLFAGARYGEQRAWLMQDGGASSTLVIRAKMFDVLFDYTTLWKGLTRRVVEATLDCEGNILGLPALMKPGAEVSSYKTDSRYPSLVAKRDGLDRGRGVSFHKLPRVPERSPQLADFFEEYRIPDPVRFKIVQGRRSALNEGEERAWKVRSYALLTPEGIVYLSSIKVICGVPVPQRLADGEVAHKGTYLATINEGGFYSAVSEEEDADYRRAVAAIGAALLGWLHRKYAPDYAGH